MIDVGGAALLGAAARNGAGVAAVGSPEHYPKLVAELGATTRVSAELRRPARRRRVRDRRRVLRRDRRLPQPDLEHDVSEAARRGPREGRRPALRREPPPAGRVLSRDDPPQRDPRRRDPAPRRAAVVQQLPGPRHGLPDRPRLHGPDGRDRQAHRPGRASRRATSSSRPTGTRSRPTRSRRSAGSSAVNRELDGATAREIAANSYEAVVAPAYSQAALGILKAKAGLEILAVPPDPTEGMRDYGIASLDFKRVAGGLLVESIDEVGLDRGRLQVVTKPPADARRAQRPPLRLADGLPRPVERDRPRPERRDGRDRRGPGQPPGLGRDRAAPGRRPGEDRGDGAATPTSRSRTGSRWPRQRRGHGDHPAGRLDPRRDGDRGRRPPPPGDGLHGTRHFRH